MVTVYDLDGVEHQRESVDARELIAIGWTSSPKVSASQSEPVIEPVVSEPEPARRGPKPKVK